MIKTDHKHQKDDLSALRKSFEDAQAGLKMAVFEAVRAQTVNRYKLEEAFKKYFEKQQQFLGKICDALVDSSKPRT